MDLLRILFKKCHYGVDEIFMKFDNNIEGDSEPINDGKSIPII